MKCMVMPAITGANVIVTTGLKKMCKPYEESIQWIQ
jgi:hypothetical protein